MNRLLYIFLTTLITCPAAQALDIKTDASYKKLVTAITQTQKLEKCIEAWQKITVGTTAQDQKEILAQALQLAQEQKAALEQELTNLGAETKNHSKIKWGGAQLVAGAYSAAALALFYCGWYVRRTTDNKLDVNKYALKTLMPCFLIDKDKHKLLFPLSAIVVILLNHIGTPYFLHKAYHNLKQGLNYKKFLQDKIANVDAIISYLQELQLTNQ